MTLHIPAAASVVSPSIPWGTLPPIAWGTPASITSGTPTSIASGTAVPIAQVTATGGSPLVAVLALVGLVVAAGLSLLIAYEALRGYRGTRDRGMLFLAVGIVLLTAGPIALRIALPTFTDSPESVRLLSTTTSELVGLGCILYAVYGRP